MYNFQFMYLYHLKVENLNEKYFERGKERERKREKLISINFDIFESLINIWYLNFDLAL